MNMGGMRLTANLSSVQIIACTPVMKFPEGLIYAVTATRIIPAIMDWERQKVRRRHWRYMWHPTWSLMNIRLLNIQSWRVRKKQRLRDIRIWEEGLAQEVRMALGAWIINGCSARMMFHGQFGLIRRKRHMSPAFLS